MAASVRWYSQSSISQGLVRRYGRRMVPLREKIIKIVFKTVI